MSLHASRLGILGPIVVVMLGLTAPLASAQTWHTVSIGGVTVQPESPITPHDPVSLDVLLLSNYGPIQLSKPTTVQILGHQIHVDIYARSGILTVLDSLVTSVPLGTLPLGSYSYHVNQRGAAHLPYFVTGGFRVVPEPCALSMLALGSLTARRRRRA